MSSSSAHRDGPYSGLPNQQVQAANGIGYAYRDTGGGQADVPVVLLQHFRRYPDSSPRWWRTGSPGRAGRVRRRPPRYS
jgi:hypothetical protein